MKRLDGNARWGLTVGLSAGLLVGVGMLCGALVAQSRWAAGWRGTEPSALTVPDITVPARGAAPAPGALAEPNWRLHAATAGSSETLAIATGPVDEEAEGAFFLDYLTGELQCYVVDARLGKFTGLFKTNIVKDLPAEKGKKPAYVMATGNWNPIRGGGAARPSNCIVYVADANTGYFAAYYFMWNRSARGTGALQAAPMLLLGTGKARPDLNLQE